MRIREKLTIIKRMWWHLWLGYRTCPTYRHSNIKFCICQAKQGFQLFADFGHGMKSKIFGMPCASGPYPLTQPIFPSFCDIHTRLQLLLPPSILSVRLLSALSFPGVPFIILCACLENFLVFKLSFKLYFL